MRLQPWFPMLPESDGGAINGPKSAAQAKTPTKKSFVETVAPPANGINPNTLISKASGNEQSGEEGKFPALLWISSASHQILKC